MTLGIVLWVLMLFMAITTPDPRLRKQRLALLVGLALLGLVLRYFHVQI
jgi:hypothetical protein